MVRCRARRAKESLVRLQIFSAHHQQPLSLDVAALCDDIAERMQLLCGIAAGNVCFVNVRPHQPTADVYDVVVRLGWATPLALAALRAACATVTAGPASGEGKKMKRRKRTALQGDDKNDGVETMPVAVRVIEVTPA